MIWVVFILFFTVIGFGVSAYTTRLQQATLQRFTFLNHLFSWERKLYRTVRVKHWKTKVPDAGGLFKNGVSKSGLQLTNNEGLLTLYFETVRGELAHWIQLFLTPILYFIVSPPLATIGCVFSFFFHVPFIIIQRYNRFRLIPLLKRRKVLPT